jgi:hypothetical protein
MRIGILRLCAIAVLAASIAQPSFAKAHRPGSGKPGAGEAVSKSGSRKGTKASLPPQIGTYAKSKGGVEPPGQEPPVPDFISNKGPGKSPSGETGIKPKPPDVAHRQPTPGPATTTTRNAIGVPVVPNQALLASGGEHVPTLPGTNNLSRGPSLNSGGLPAGHQSQIAIDPTVGAAKISRSASIRPRNVPLSPAVVGGPAKSALGINGTILRPKH